MSWHFALTPKWIVRHVLVLALVATMIGLAIWQVQRLDEKRTYKRLVEARQEQPVVDVADVVPAQVPTTSERVTSVLYRRVRASGVYADDDTVVVANRTFNSAPGGWVLTPLRLEGGTSVVVNRGFVGFDRAGEIVAPTAPSGRVAVEGLIFPSQRRGSFGPVDPDGRQEVLARADLDRLAVQLDYPILPAYVQLVESTPAEPPTAPGAAALVPLGPPRPGEGPHLAYAGQWAIFTIIAAGGYVLLLRRVAQDRSRAAGPVD